MPKTKTQYEVKETLSKIECEEEHVTVAATYTQNDGVA